MGEWAEKEWNEMPEGRKSGEQQPPFNFQECEQTQEIKAENGSFVRPYRHSQWGVIGVRTETHVGGHINWIMMILWNAIKRKMKETGTGENERPHTIDSLVLQSRRNQKFESLRLNRYIYSQLNDWQVFGSFSSRSENVFLELPSISGGRRRRSSEATRIKRRVEKSFPFISPDDFPHQSTVVVYIVY